MSKKFLNITNIACFIWGHYEYDVIITFYFMEGIELIPDGMNITYESAFRLQHRCTQRRLILKRGNMIWTLIRFEQYKGADISSYNTQLLISYST